MARSNPWGANETISRGASLARTDIAMDAFISEEDKILLYEKWNNNWGKPLELTGRVLSITTNLVAEAPWEEFLEVYGIEKATYLRTIAETNKR
jgi:hypothetical protein